MRDVKVRWTDKPFAQDIEVAGHRLRADEELDKGGTDSGPAPHEFLLAALGTCTASTLRVYAERKGWPLTDVQVQLNGGNVDGAFVISRTVTLAGDLDTEQRQRLLEIADKCPVHKTLTGQIVIRTQGAA
jgi:putative redox protein